MRALGHVGAGAGDGARGCGRRRWGAGAGARGVRGARGARDRRARGARAIGGTQGRGAAWACCWASGLCTWCTQPVLTRFDLVLFLSHYMNTVHYKNFSEK